MVLSNRVFDNVLAKHPDVRFVSDLGELDAALDDGCTTLVSCISSVIVPQFFIARFSIALNIHPGLPAYPGRDPHHWAHYYGTSEWGATLHKMEDTVDSGEIYYVESTPVDVQKMSPIGLKRIGECNAEAILMSLLGGDIDLVESGLKWGSRKYRRADFLDICNLSESPEAEHEKVINSFHVEGHRNVYLVKNGRRFFLE